MTARVRKPRYDLNELYKRAKSAKPVQVTREGEIVASGRDSTPPGSTMLMPAGFGVS